ncbi:A24 family peptidase [Vibrio makurazakiensis]|uniref:prepilin peptidase n=1 Tax=Vibrio makurazakiensis TaxID=2910250 RepID=UPI003D0FF98D
MEILIWSILLVIAVYDSRDNRIPNIWLLPLIILSAAYHFQMNGLTASLSALGSGVIFFGLGLLLYFLKAMAPGDVKLLGAVGVFCGWGNLLASAYWITVGAGIVASFYLLLFLATKPDESKLVINEYSQSFLYGHNQVKANRLNNSNKLRMPFAPAVVIGLALFSYF